MKNKVILKRSNSKILSQLALFIALIPLLTLNACGQNNDSNKGDKTLTIFAAASLTDAFEEIAEKYESENSDVQIELNFAGSSTLAAQIIEGAPADIFASANLQQMEVIQDSGDISTEPIIFATNRLIVIVPADNPADIQSLQDLANNEVLLVVAAQSVPVREYTDLMLDRLAANDDYGASYRQAVLNNIVSEESNVRQISAKVALGEADAGIVYASDVTPDIADKVLTIPIPDEYNTIATYPIAIISHSDQSQLAQDFVDFVLSDTGQDTLAKWNFISIHDRQTAP